MNKDSGNGKPDKKTGWKRKKTKQFGETTNSMSESEKLRFLHIVGGTLKHEIFNMLQAVAFSNETLAGKYGRDSNNEIISETIVKLIDLVNTLANMKEIHEQEYPGNEVILDLHYGESKECG